MTYNIIFPIGSNFPVVFACEKLSQHYFISFVDQLLGRALHPSFYCMLAFAWWIFVLPENYQVKFHLIVTKTLSKTPKQKTISYVVQCILGRFNFILKDV